MPRFYFDFWDGGETLTDKEGAEFQQFSEAMRDARQFLLEMLRNAPAQSNDSAVFIRGDNESQPLACVRLFLREEVLLVRSQARRN
jgi:hypothetical protein